MIRQTIETADAIAGFFGENRWLSNFHPCSVRVKMPNSDVEMTFASSEHTYQAMKSLDHDEWAVIAFCETPGKAKRAAKNLTLREDWNLVKVDVMREVVFAKFSQNEDLRKRLLATGQKEFFEVNDWGDSFWGCDSKLRGENWLGRILFETRLLVTEFLQLSREAPQSDK